MRKRTIIDIHTHFIPDVVATEASSHPSWGVSVEQRDGAPWLVHEQGFAYPFFDIFHNARAKIADMDEKRIDRSILSLSPTMFNYWIPAGEGRTFSELANDALAELVASSPSRLAGLATLPLQDPQSAAAELARSVEELGLLGAQIGATVEGRQLDSPEFLPVWEAVDALGVPLVLHPYYVGPKTGLEDFYLTNIFGNPLETALTASRLIFSGLFDRFQKARVVLVHGGGFLPYQIGRLDHGWQVRPEAKSQLGAPPSEYLDRFFFDSITHHDGALAWLAALVGDDHVLLGSDLPFDMGDPRPVERVERSLDSEESKDRVAGENAMKLFGLPAGSPE